MAQRVPRLAHRAALSTAPRRCAPILHAARASTQRCGMTMMLRPRCPGSLTVPFHPHKNFGTKAVQAPSEEDDLHRKGAWMDWARLGAVATGCAVSWAQAAPHFHGVDLVAVATAVGGGVPIYKEVWDDLKERRVTMAVSMSLGIFASLLSQEYFTASLITFVVLCAEKLEHMVTARGERAVQSLLELLPATAERRAPDGSVQTVPLAELRIGDVILVRPGCAVAVDGRVTSGASYVREAAITGEPLPVHKTAGSTVYAGTVNESGALEVRVVRVGADTAYGAVLATLQNASLRPAPVQRTADRMAKFLVLFALSAATATYLLTASITAATSVVVVAGSCGIAVGTPLAIVAGIGRAARCGAIVKGGAELEALAHVDTVVFDKTGTLTHGSPSVRAVLPRPPYSASQLLALAAEAEARSEHPLAQAVVRAAKLEQEQRGERTAMPVPLAAFEVVPGMGVAGVRSDGQRVRVGSRRWLEQGGVRTEEGSEGQGAGGVWVSLGEQLVGRIRVDDALRPDASALVARLRQRGVRQVLLTGDAPEAAQRVAAELGIDEARASQLPADKLAYVQALTSSGRRVAVVGDGINDALALAAADVSVAMGTAADVSKQVASVVLIGNELLLLDRTIRIAQRVRTIIQQNFWGTIGCAVVGMAFAATGVLPPVLAAALHGASDIVWILNSSRAYAPLPDEQSATKSP